MLASNTQLLSLDVVGPNPTWLGEIDLSLEVVEEELVWKAVFSCAPNLRLPPLASCPTYGAP